MKRNIVILISAFTFLLSLPFILFSCKDDDIYSETGDGEATLKCMTVFSPVKNALDGTKSSGTALKHINSVCVLIYDRSGKLYRKVPQTDLKDYQVENNNNAPDDAKPSAETNTPQATFKIEGIPYGNYYIYAVANMGDLDGLDVSTPAKLKELPLVWNVSDVSKNDQMFGYFTPADAMRSDGFDGPLITVNRPAQEIHSWVKRAASKVTVNVDGSALNPGVEVWIKSIQIKDIPRYCFLGQDNAISSHLIAEGEKIIVSNQPGQTGPSVSKTDPMLFENAHAEDAEALYFYENMQGTGQSKHQSWDNGTSIKFPNGNTPGDDGFKDAKPAGSYIEVTGWYKNSSGSGPIIYRFMLGKDVDNNYDAQRNYHYKLTLRLRRNANENDWHIVYDPLPDILLDPPYYISYTYDQQMFMNFKLVGRKLISLRTDILNNEINQNSWHAVTSDGSVPPEADGSLNSPYYTGAIDNPGPWNGFLSTRKTTEASFGPASEFPGNEAKTYKENERYWIANSRGWRTYDVSDKPGGLHTDSENGDYYIIPVGGVEWNVRLPFYTRAKQMVAQTAYTGNNPYVAYRRLAQVRITAEIEDNSGVKKTIVKETPLFQMRRIVNPKAIWRDGDDSDSFHIQLKVQTSETSDFTDLQSDGGWVAVAKNGSWFTLTPTPGKSQKNADGTISAEGGPIDFTWKPNGKTDTPRFGIIKVYYNNFTCVHLIFVRQGYAPVSFYSGKAKWHTFNLVSKGKETTVPVSSGSFFKLYNQIQPIDESNNTSDWFNKDAISREFALATGGKSLWNNIKVDYTSWGDFTVNSKTCRLPDEKDFKVIIDNPNTVYGYGVLYADGSTETATKYNEVYNASQTNYKGRGIRGVIACDTITGTQIFFPIGASGFGRFKREGNGSYPGQKKGWTGVLQYAYRFEPFPTTAFNSDGTIKSYGVNYKPLFWDLWRRHGGFYWLDNIYSLDINFYTFDFSVANAAGSWGLGSNSGIGSDAVMIRLVEGPKEK